MGAKKGELRILYHLGGKLLEGGYLLEEIKKGEKKGIKMIARRGTIRETKNWPY